MIQEEKKTKEKQRMFIFTLESKQRERERERNGAEGPSSKKGRTKKSILFPFFWMSVNIFLLVSLFCLTVDKERK